MEQRNSIEQHRRPGLIRLVDGTRDQEPVPYPQLPPGCQRHVVRPPLSNKPVDLRVQELTEPVLLRSSARSCWKAVHQPGIIGEVVNSKCDCAACNWSTPAWRSRFDTLAFISD